MADNTTLNAGSGGDVIRTEDIGGVKISVVKIHTGPNDSDGGPVTGSNPLHTQGVSGSLTGLLVGGLALSSANPIPVSDAGGSFTVDGAVSVLSGSVTGLLVGGNPLAASNPVPVSDAGGSFTVDGAVSVLSGSVTGLLVGGNSLSLANPVPITGSLSLSQGVAVISGSVIGLLVGGVPLASANPVPVTGSVTLASVASVTGTVTLAAVAAITGSVSLAQAATTASGSVVGLLVGGQAASLGNPVPVGMNLEGGGQILSGTVTRVVQYTFGDFGTSGSANQVVGPQGSGNRVRVLSAALMSSGPVNVKWKSTGSAGTVTDIAGRFYLPASGGFVLPHNPHGWFQTIANEGLNIALDSNTSVGIVLTWMIAGP